MLGNWLWVKPKIHQWSKWKWRRLLVIICVTIQVNLFLVKLLFRDNRRCEPKVWTMPSKRLFRTTFVFTLITCIFIVPSFTSETREADLEPDGRCVERRFDEVRTFYYGDNAQPITILTSDRVTHKIVSSILVRNSNSTLISIEPNSTNYYMCFRKCSQLRFSVIPMSPLFLQTIQQILLTLIYNLDTRRLVLT